MWNQRLFITLETQRCAHVVYMGNWYSISDNFPFNRGTSIGFKVILQTKPDYVQEAVVRIAPLGCRFGRCDLEGSSLSLLVKRQTRSGGRP